MCLMQTDFPVPEGPRIIETWPSGRPRFSPRRTRLEPKALWTSTNSIASGTFVGRFVPVWNWKSSSSAGSIASSFTAIYLSSDWGSWVGAPEDLGAEHADEVHEAQVEDHRLSG